MLKTINEDLGKSFRYLNYVLVAVKSHEYDCSKCFFSTLKDCGFVKCADFERKDGNNVVYIIDQRKSDRINIGCELCDKLIARYNKKETIKDLKTIKKELEFYKKLILEKNDIIEKLKARR